MTDIGPVPGGQMTRSSSRVLAACAAASLVACAQHTVAKRCTDKWEGDRRLSVVDCASVGLVCKADAAGKVGCYDKDSTSPGTTAPPPPAPPSFSKIKQQVFEVSMGLHRKAVQKLQGR
jgi:hypothetical protein